MASVPSSKLNSTASADLFQSIGNDISFYKTAPPPSSITPSNAPALIILATWFSALPRHVSKYTSRYRIIYPYASILVLDTSMPDMVYRPYSTQQKNLHPALTVLSQYNPNEILLHVFSNSGAHKISQLARAYREQTGKPLTVGALVLDSAPGINTFRGITDGFIGGLPSTPVVKHLLSLVVYGLVGTITVKEVVTRDDHFIQRLRRDLNDHKLLSSKRGRVYIYSKNDKIVAWEDVESHAKAAKEKGAGPVDMYLWDGSGHVGHRTKDDRKYWEVVTKLWAGEQNIKSRL